MANVNLRKAELSDCSDPKKLQEYLNSMFEEMEYILTNVDEDNMTDSYNKKTGVQKSE